MMNKRHMLFFIASVLSLLTLSACINVGRVRVGDTETVSETVEIGEANEAEVEITMGAGRLTIAGGAEALMNADFTYNVEEWAPEVDYSLSGDTGRLSVRQPSQELAIPDSTDIVYEWDLRLSDTLPLDLVIRLGAGENRLSLDDLNMSTLDLQTGAGEVELSVPGTLEDLEIETGAGALEVDLSADWQQDLDAVIRGGVGQVTLLLPQDVGVRVDVDQGLGDINASGLTREANDYVNDAYGESDITLEIGVSGGIGQVNLELVD